MVSPQTQGYGAGALEVSSQWSEAPEHCTISKPRYSGVLSEWVKSLCQDVVRT